MAKRERQYWTSAVLQAFLDTADDKDDWFFFHWFWALKGVETIYT